MKLSLFSFIFLIIAARSATAAVTCSFNGSLSTTGSDCNTSTTGNTSGTDNFSGYYSTPPTAPTPTVTAPTTPTNPGSGGGSNAAANQQNGNSNNSNTNENNSNNSNGNNNANNAGAGNTTGNASFDACVNQSQNLINECAKKRESALSNCDTNSNSSLTSAMGTASQMTTAMSSSAPSASGSCSNMGMLGASAQAALAGYQMTCSNAKNSCVDACENARKSMVQCAGQSGISLMAIQATEGYRDVSSNYSQCSSQQAKVDQAGTALTNIMSETQKAKECAAQLAAMNTPSNDPNSVYCKAHPTVASCILDCNHPNMASNQTCICMKNPYDASCGGAGSSGSVAGGFNTTSGGGARVAASKSNPTIGSDTLDIDRLNEIGTEGRRKMAGQAAEEAGGKQGGSANVGAATPDNSGSARGGGAALPAEVPGGNVNSGFYGAGGGSGGGGGGSGYGEGAGGSYAAGGASTANGAGGLGAPDLRKFLPGGQMDPARRGIAGINGVDGISGPSETNWAKMQRRYRYLESTFLP